MWVSASIISKLPVNFYSKYTLPVKVSIENSQNELLCLICILSLMIKSKINFDKALNCFGYVSLIFSFFALFFNERWFSGIVVNKSMNAILVSMLLPYIFNFYTFIASALVVILSKSSSAYLSFFGMIFIFFLRETKNPTKFLKYFIPLPLFLYFFDKDILFGGSRLIAYKFFFSDFSIWNFLFGKGAASFFSIASYRQTRELFDLANGYYVWMHSDILQFIYEYGIFGLIPLAFVAFKTNFSKKEFYSLIAICLGSVFYYPFHFPVHLFVLFMVITNVFRRENVTS